MFAVSATRTNQGAARIIAQRNAERKRQERLMLEAQAAAKAEAEREAAEKLEAIAKSVAIVSSFRAVEIILGARSPVKDIVIHAVAGTKYTAQDILGHRRMRAMTDLRHYAILCAWAFRPDQSLPQLGKLLGGRDHTTIIHAKNRFDFDRREEAARFIKQHGRDATLARLKKSGKAA